MVIIFSALMLSVQCVVKPPDANDNPVMGVISVVGVTKSSNKKLVGKPCVGVATMLADKTLVFNYVDEFIDRKHHSIEFKYPLGSVGYRGAAETIGSIHPGDVKIIPPSPPTIGVASMAADGTLTIQLRMVSSSGSIGEGRTVVKPTDPNYTKIVQQLGIKPGQLKPMPVGGMGDKHDETEDKKLNLRGRR